MWISGFLAVWVVVVMVVVEGMGGLWGGNQSEEGGYSICKGMSGIDTAPVGEGNLEARG